MLGRILTAFVVCALSGCATNNYEEFFVSRNRQYFNALPTFKAEDPVKLRLCVKEEDVVDAMEDGYVPVGSSSFHAPYSSMAYAVDTAKAHGAQLVFFDFKFKEKEERTSVIFLPSTSTSYSHGTVNASVYSGGRTAFGTGTYSGSTTTTTMNAVPVNYKVDIYTHNALFLRRINPKDFYGLIPFIPRKLPMEKPLAIIPVTVLAVVHGSQAEKDGIVKGQRIKSINGSPLSNRASVEPFSRSITSIKKVEVVK